VVYKIAQAPSVIVSIIQIISTCVEDVWVCSCSSDIVTLWDRFVVVDFLDLRSFEGCSSIEKDLSWFKIYWVPDGVVYTKCAQGQPVHRYYLSIQRGSIHSFAWHFTIQRGSLITLTCYIHTKRANHRSWITHVLGLGGTRDRTKIETRSSRLLPTTPRLFIIVCLTNSTNPKATVMQSELWAIT